MDSRSGWQPDPAGRHEERYFNGYGLPTNRVRNNGIEAADEDRVQSAGEQVGAVAEDAAASPSSTSSAPAIATAQSEPNDTGRVLVTRYADSHDIDGTRDAPTGRIPAISRDHALGKSPGHRPVWAFVAIGVLLLALIAVGVFAYQQHHDASTWEKQYHAEVTNYQAEFHKSAGIFVSLLASQQQVKTLTNEKNRACLVLESVTRAPSRLSAAGCT